MAEVLSKFGVWPTIAVKDLPAGRKFYGDVLGYSNAMMEDNEAVALQGHDGTGILLYRSEDNAGSNRATYATWAVQDLEGVMKDLKGKGVEFEEYDQPGLKTEQGVAKWEQDGKSMKAAWFRDPDGNILNLTEM